jgi:hypothetical protein
MATFPTQFKVGGSTGAANAFLNRDDGYFSIQFNIADWVAKGYVKTDVATLFTIPARSRFVLEAVYSDNTVSFGTTPTLSLGDSAGGTTFINAQTPGAANVRIATVALSSKIYDTADAITMTLNNASGTVTSGLITVVGRILDLSANPVAQASVSV